MTWLRTEAAKRAALGLIGAGLLALLAWTGGIEPARDAYAQSPLPTEQTATPTFTPALGATPSPTPTKLKRTVNEITEPKSTDAIFGWTNIIGTALVDAFNRFDVHIAPAGMENWQWLTTSFDVIHDSPLYVLDTMGFADGVYDLRVRAIANGGAYTEAFVRGVEVRNTNPPTLTPDPSPRWTPTPVSPLLTPTPAVLTRIPGGQGFYAPDTGAVVDGVVEIKATVNGTRDQRFERYELEISPAGLEKWVWLHSEPTQVWQNTIYTLDTTEHADGRYDLRLRNVYDDGNYSEYFVRNVTFANTAPAERLLAPAAGIVSPRSGSRASGIVDFVGTVPQTDLLRWELSWSPGQREDWSFLVGGEQPAAGEAIASLDLSQLPPGQYDFRLRIVRSDYNYTDYYVRDMQVHANQ